MSRSRKSASDFGPAELEKKVQSGQVEPLYLFLGEDNYLKDSAIRRLVTTVDEGFREFNIERFSLQETSVVTVLDAARQLPMFSKRRLLIVNDVDKLKDDASIDTLIEYLNHPIDTTCVVFVATTLDGRRRHSAALQKRCVVVTFDHLQDREAGAWAERYLKAHGVTIEQSAVGLLVGLVGGNLSHLTNELEKLITYVGPAKRITSRDVESLVPRTRPTNNFDLGDAVLANKTERALRLFRRMIADGAEPVAIVGMLAWSYRTALIAKEMMERKASMIEVSREARVSPRKEEFFKDVRKTDIKKIVFGVKRIAQVDLAIKTSAGTPRLQLEHLICELTSPTSFK